jgi:hypothetical protein
MPIQDAIDSKRNEIPVNWLGLTFFETIEFHSRKLAPDIGIGKSDVEMRAH